EITQGAQVTDAEPRTYDRLALAKPRYIPGKPYGRPEAVQVVTFQIHSNVGIWRILPDKLHIYQIAARRVESARSLSNIGGTLHTKECILVSDDSRRQAVCLVRLAIIFPVNAEI